MKVDDSTIRMNCRHLMATLRQRKQDLGISYEDLAEKAGIGSGYCANILSPMYLQSDKNIGVEILLRLLTALDLEITIDVKGSRINNINAELRDVKRHSL